MPMRKFVIDDFTVNPDGNEIITKDKTLKLESKTMSLLTLLAENAEQTISKEEIFKEVWPDMIVTEDSISRCISQLRKVFNDDPQHPRVIETIPRKGYRLKVPVQFIEHEHGKSMKVERRTPQRRHPIPPWIAGGIAALIALGSIYGVGSISRGQGWAIIIAAFSVVYLIFYYLDRKV